MQVRNATGHSLDFGADWQDGHTEPDLLVTCDGSRLVIGCHNEQMRLTRDEVVDFIARMQDCMFDGAMHTAVEKKRPAPDRRETTARIRKALKQRSGKTWSVTGGIGTAWGWITIQAPPKRREEFGYTSEAECAELADLLGLDCVHSQGVSIPDSSAYRVEYIDRAEGRTPSEVGTPYWD